MKAIVDRETCISCGLCESLCPAVFTLDEESISVPVKGEIPAEHLDDAEQAMEQCPVAAISME